MSVCVRPACRAELPDGPNYCHTCGAPQLAPCPVCGYGGDTGLGFSLETGQCPRCRTFLRHCPNCRKAYSLEASHCDNPDWTCAGTELVGGSQSFACLGANPQRSYALVEALERYPSEGTAEFTRAWRLELPQQRSLSDVVVAHGRVYAVNLRSQRALSVPLWLDREVDSSRQRFGFDDGHTHVDTSEGLALLRNPVIRDLSVRGGHLSFLVVPKPVRLHDGRIEQAPEAVAFLLEASTLRLVRQSRRDRIRMAHLSDHRWLLVTDGNERSGESGFRYSLSAVGDGTVIADVSVPARLDAAIPAVEANGRVYLSSSEGIVEVDLDDGSHSLLRSASLAQDVRGLVALGRTVMVLTSGDRVGHHRLLGVDREMGTLTDLASLNVPIDAPLAALDDTLYLLDDNAKTLRAYSVGAANVFPSPDLNVRLRDLGDTRALVLVRSGQALHLARQVNTDQGFTSFQVEQIRPTERGTIGFHRIRSPDSSFAYADGRLFVVDKYLGTIEALEVFQP